MADIELVIKIPEEMYKQIIDKNGIDTMFIPYSDIIRSGTPLPKGHGRLIDGDELDNDLKERQKSYEHTSCIRQLINEAVKDGIIIAKTHIDEAPTIIEADAGE